MVMSYKEPSSVKMVSNSKSYSSLCEGTPYLEKVRSPHVSLQPPAWQQTNTVEK